MNIKLLTLGAIYFVIGQIIIWFQSHLQFFNNWSKDNPLLIAIPGVLVSYVSILATKHLAEAWYNIVFSTHMDVIR